MQIVLIIYGMCGASNTPDSISNIARHTHCMILAGFLPRYRALIESASGGAVTGRAAAARACDRNIV
jgi:hypothetical protein